MRPARGASGYTLAEMVIVVGIIGVIAVAATPWFMRIAQRGQIKSAAYEIHSTLLGARMRAVKRNQQVTVQFIPAVGAEDFHRILTNEPGADGPVVRDEALIPRKTFNFTALPVGNQIIFRGDGSIGPITAANANVAVQGPVGSGSPNTVTIETSASGRVRVVTPNPWL